MRWNLSALLLCLATVSATAATPKGSAPTRDFLQIRLSEPLSIPECPYKEDPPFRGKSNRRYDAVASINLVCWEHAYSYGGDKIGQPVDPTFEAVEIQMWKLPRGLGGNVDATVINGKVERLRVKTSGQNYQDDILALLTDKYGKPTSLSRDPVQNLMGASFTRVFAEWDFTDLKVTFLGMWKVGEGSLEVETAVAIAHSDKLKRDAEAGAIKL